MKITGFETLHGDAVRCFSFLKVTTDVGITGWSEFTGINERNRRMGLDSLIHDMMRSLMGRDPREIERISGDLLNDIKLSQSGLNHQAIGAVQNAIIDITAKDLGVPVYKLFGGPVRTRIPLYWSHFGMLRMGVNAQRYELDPINTLDDFANHVEDARSAGYGAIKTKIHYFDENGGNYFFPTYGWHSGGPELNLEPKIFNAIVAQMAALRDVAGDDIDVILDINNNFKSDGMVRVARAIEPYNPRWLEIDLFDAETMRDIRDRSPVSIGGCEMICTARTYKPFFVERAIDVPLVDVAWNGLLESIRIANVADVFDLNISPHNFTAHLCTMMHGHYAAVIPNFQIMEFDVDEAPWLHEFFTEPLPIENGELVLSDKPGWGMDVVEEAVRAHPPRVSLE
ncbi:mandelate racemase/muconate lactonizing enzyme family protein [Thalassolituus sp.]|uniref:mandelate racemase/muconate lactonizing enzyme family protein n=1 Tax=Thalassolituus sp. TaxID=2030822 RepID=UPI0035169EAA